MFSENKKMLLLIQQFKLISFWCTCLLISTVQSLHLRIKREENYCYSKDANPYAKFGSLTAYELSRGDVTDISIPKGKVDYYCKYVFANL